VQEKRIGVERRRAQTMNIVCWFHMVDKEVDRRREHYSRDISTVETKTKRKKLRKEAKRSKRDVKTNSKLVILSETKQNKVRIPQFRLYEPYKTILTHAKSASFVCFASKQNWHFSQNFPHVSLWVTMVLRGSCK
jgi:hypothetical protein